jgi:ABC-2 type transport system permease protein
MIGGEDVESALPGLLLFIMGYWQLTPLVTLSLGVSLEMRKLALYPVSVPTLFLVECLLRLWTGLEMILVLTGIFVGLATTGRQNLLALLAGLLLFVAFNMFFSAGMRNLVERIFQRRMLRETVLVLMVTLTVLPQMLVFSDRFRDLAHDAVREDTSLPTWAAPSGVCAAIALGTAGWVEIALALAYVAVAGVFGYTMFRSSCKLTSASTAGEQAPRLRASRSRASWFGRLIRALSAPFPDPLGALLEKEIKYLWRSPRFRLPFFMGFTFGVIAWTPVLHRVEGDIGQWMKSGAVSLISLYAMLLLGPVLFLNRFGFDRGATRFYFWMPVGFEELLAAKNLATCVFAFFETAAVGLMCWLAGLPVGPWEILEALAVTTTALFYLQSVGNHMSVHYPIASNPDRVSRAGQGHGLRAAVQFVCFPVSLTPIFFAFVWRYLFGSQAAFIWMMLAAAILGGLIYWTTFLQAASFAQKNRELFIGHLTRGEGPLAAE